MKSIKQQYIDLREGNMTQANFMRNLRMTLPQYITNLSSFEDSIKILKNKGILTEADTNSGPNAQWLRSIKDIIEDMWQNGEIKTPAEYGSAMTKLSQYPEGIVAQYGETSAADAANKLLDSVAGVANDYDPGPGEDENFERDYDMDYEEPNEPFDMAEMLDPTAAEEIAKAAGSYEVAVDKLMDMGLSSQEADRIANELYPEEEEYDEDEAAEAERVNMMIDQGLEDRFNESKSLREAKDEKGKWTNADGKSMYGQFDEINNLNAQEVLIGIDYEMQKNEELTKSAAAKIVVKNLKKNPIYYTSEDMSGVEGYEPEYIGGKSANPEAHQMQYLDKNMGNVVDKKRGMQPVKGVEKAKKDSDKGGETNKAVKGIDLMSLIAKTVRGMKKMDATGEKMKKIVMKEGMEGQYTFNGYFKGGELDRLMTMIPDAEIDNQVEFGQGAKTTIFSQQHSDEEIKKAVNSVIGMNEDKSKVNLNNLTMSDAAKRAKKIHDEEEKKRKERNSKLTKESLMNMIREELKEMMDGMEPMSREDGSSYINKEQY